MGNETLIDFNRFDARSLFEKNFREGAFSWAYFENELSFLNICCSDNFAYNVFVEQKVLGKGFVNGNLLRKRAENFRGRAIAFDQSYDVLAIEQCIALFPLHTFLEEGSHTLFRPSLQKRAGSFECALSGKKCDGLFHPYLDSFEG